MIEYAIEGQEISRIRVDFAVVLQTVDGMELRIETALAVTASDDAPFLTARPTISAKQAAMSSPCYVNESAPPPCTNPGVSISRSVAVAESSVSRMRTLRRGCSRPRAGGASCVRRGAESSVGQVGADPRCLRSIVYGGEGPTRAGCSSRSSGCWSTSSHSPVRRLSLQSSKPTTDRPQRAPTRITLRRPRLGRACSAMCGRGLHLRPNSAVRLRPSPRQAMPQTPLMTSWISPHQLVVHTSLAATRLAAGTCGQAGVRARNRIRPCIHRGPGFVGSKACDTHLVTMIGLSRETA
jgi:hypothetical protein